MSHLVIVKTNDGLVYWPAYGINTIGTVHLGEAYQVYTTGADTMKVTGTPVNIADEPVPLSTGWNMTAYLPKVNLPVATALAGVLSQIKIVKNNDGDVYWPAYGIDDIGTMYVGQGYMMNMKNSTSLTYPSGLGKQGVVASGISMPKVRHYVYNGGNTGSNATVLITRIVQGNKLVSDSSEIGVYDVSGNLVGSGTIMGGKAAFSIWGDNAMTKEKDGLASSETFTFKLWRTNGEVNDLLFVGEGADKGYTQNGLILGAMSVHANIMVTKFALANAYPNPFRNTVRIAFDVASINGRDMQNVEINVYDVRGSLVRQVVKGQYKTGHYTVAWDGNDHLGSNMYIVEMKADQFSQKMKLFRVK
jgi:flagellar hook assembly protein FlgD